MCQVFTSSVEYVNISVWILNMYCVFLLFQHHHYSLVFGVSLRKIKQAGIRRRSFTQAPPLWAFRKLSQSRCTSHDPSFIVSSCFYTLSQHDISQILENNSCILRGSDWLMAKHRTWSFLSCDINSSSFYVFYEPSKNQQNIYWNFVASNIDLYILSGLDGRSTLVYTSLQTNDEVV